MKTMIRLFGATAACGLGWLLTAQANPTSPSPAKAGAKQEIPVAIFTPGSGRDPFQGPKAAVLCPLHHVAMKRETVPILYGPLPSFYEDYMKAALTLFPNTAKVWGGIKVLPESPLTRTQPVCPQCNLAADKWIQDYAPLKDSPQKIELRLAGLIGDQAAIINSELIRIGTEAIVKAGAHRITVRLVEIHESKAVISVAGDLEAPKTLTLLQPLTLTLKQ